jgi:hypothetical protein
MQLPTSFRRLLAGAAATLALAAAPAAAQASIQLGVYTPGAPAEAKPLSEYAEMVGRQPDIVMWYRDLGQPLMYSNEIKNLGATGQTPLVTWEPYEQSLPEIASGSDDKYLHEAAAVAKSWGKPMMIRFAHEMNGNWYPWGASSATSTTSSSSYISAYRHVVDVFRADGAQNVKWVWSPNVQEATKYQMTPYFPGDDYVDYVGLDGYNWGTNNGESWQTFEQVFASSYATATQLTGDPVIVTETGSSEAGGDKAAWIRTSFMTTIPQKFPRISAVIWFNKAKEDDWRINSSQASLDAYRAVVNCPIYGGSGSCEGGEAPAEEPTKPKGKGKKPKVRSVHVTRTVPSTVDGQLSYGITQPGEVEIRVVPRGHKGAKAVIHRKSGKGHHRLPLARILHRRHLHLGKYRVIVTARNHEGRRSRPHKAHFRVI